MTEKATRGAEPINITQKAIDRIKHVLKAEGKEGYGLRINVAVGGCAGLHYELSLEKDSRSNDEIIAAGRVKIFIDKDSKKYLEGTEIDYVDSLTSSRLVINNPNIQFACSCGQSFNV
jgi:iron-sulfur cluster assembly protein